MFSPVATGLFCVRNGGKTTGGDIGRAPVTVGQAASVVKAFAQNSGSASIFFDAHDAMTSAQSVSKSDKILNFASKGINWLAGKTRTVLNTCEEIAKSDKFFNGVSKTVKFASDHVNPLIVASSGLKVALADKKDRKNTLISESGSIAGMFIGEGWMKNNLTGILEKLPISKKWLPVVKGVVFVAGSITASTIGQKIGQKAAQYWDVPLSKSAREPKAAAQGVYKPMDLKA